MKKERSGKTEEKIIFHIDVNSAFLSWSAVKKLREEPGSVDLRTIPAVVGGDQTKRHGIVTAKSLPAKKYGIRTAETIASAVQKCPGLVIIPSDFQTYREYSRGFLKILREYTSLVEQASIDEAYMDATELCRRRMETGGESAGNNQDSVPGGAGKKQDSVPGVAGKKQDSVPGGAGHKHYSVPGGAENNRKALMKRAELSGEGKTNLLRETAIQLAGEIRRRIFGELGFTVNVGVSSNRLLAKMASDFAKPDRTHTLFPEEVPQKMWPLPIGELYGCGSRTSQRLLTLGIQTIGDAAKIPVEVLIDHLGEKSGKYIHNAANGIGRAGVSPVREDAKSYSNEWTTSSDITQETYEAEFMPLLQHLCDKVAGRLQRDGVYGKTVVVTVKTDDFRRRSAQRQLRDASNRTEILFQAAAGLADKLLLGEKGLFAEGAGVRLVGAGVTDLDDGAYRQMSLLDWEPEDIQENPEDRKRRDSLEEQEISEGVDAEEPRSREEIITADIEKNEKIIIAENEKIIIAETDQRGNEVTAETDQPEDKGASETVQPASKLDRAARLLQMETMINRRFGDGAVYRGAVSSKQTGKKSGRSRPERSQTATDRKEVRQQQTGQNPKAENGKEPGGRNVKSGKDMA